MNVQADNPKAVAGDNEAPAYAQRITEQMAADYRDLAEETTNKLTEARAGVPETIETEEQLGLVNRIVVELRDIAAKAVAFHKKEKEPFLRGGQAVDSFFFDIRDRATKAGDIIGKRGHAFNLRKLESERVKAAAEAEAARKLADEKKAEEDRLAADAEEARQKLERARKPETIEKLAVEATQIEKKAETAAVDAAVTRADAQVAQQATQRSSADIARVRHDSGRLSTMKQVGYVEITDFDKLPTERLWPYLKNEHIEAAVKAFAKKTGHKVSLPGAIIEMRDDTVYK